MIVLISGTDKQLTIFKGIIRERVSADWYTYDYIPKQFLEYINATYLESELTAQDTKLLREMTDILDKHSEVCYRDCMSVINDYLKESSAKFLFITVPHTKIMKFKDLKCIRVKVINDPNLVSGNLKYEKHSIYDYALYNATTKDRMQRKVIEFLNFCKEWEKENG